MDSNLRAKILREQDKLIYFSYNSWDECLFSDHIDSELDFVYTNFNGGFLEENCDIIPELKSKNLLYLLSSTKDKVKEIAIDTLMKRVKEDGEHFYSGENASYEAFGSQVDMWIAALNAVGKENVSYIKNRIFENLEAVREKDEYAHSIINKAGYITSIDNFLTVYEQGTFTLEKLQLLEKLSKENPNILDSINYRIFDDVIFEMGEEFISKIARFPNVSNKIIMIAENNPKLLATIKQGFVNLKEDKKRPEILEIQDKVITYAAKNFSQLEDITFEDLANNALRGNEVSLDGNGYIVEKDSESEFDRRCDEQYEKLTQSHNSNKYINVISDKKKILIMKYFGINKSQAEKFCNRFKQDIDSIDVENIRAVEYLEKLKRVLGLETEAEIDELYYSINQKITPLERVHYEYSLREAYSQTYVEELAKTNDNLDQISDVEFVDVDGKQVKKINLKGEFSILAHSTDSGFKGDKKLLDGSFTKSWRHIADPNRHLASSCYLTQDFMGYVPANENGFLAVYTKATTEDISLMGPTDIDSNIKNFDYSSNKGLYISAKNMPQNSRRVYSEIPIERRDPDYLLIFDDTTEDVLQNTYKAAAEFGIDVIFIDKVEVEKQQLAKLDELTLKFKETQDLEILANLISMYETNVAGWLLNRDPQKEDDSYTNKIDNERFREDFEERETVIYEMLQNYVEQSFQSGNNSNLSQVASILQTEIEKYNLVNIGNTPISQTKMKFDAVSILEQIRQKTPDVLRDSEEIKDSSFVSEVSFFNIAKMVADDVTIGIKEVNEVTEKLLSNIIDKGVSYGE